MTKFVQSNEKKTP